MRPLHIDEQVRLSVDIPELRLTRGDVGVVRSTWCSPLVAYEVEFHAADDDAETRVLVGPEQLVLDRDELVLGSELSETLPMFD